MARPRSDTKRNEILAAAIRIIAAQGLGASTALIGRSAGVSNGALFTYFETKAALLNQLYIELKLRMAETTVAGVPAIAEPQDKLRYAWYGMLRWAADRPQERVALAQLGMSKDVTEASRAIAREPYAPIEALLDRCRTHGAMRDASPAFVVSLIMATVDATIDALAAEPDAAERHAAIGFDALWRMIN